MATSILLGDGDLMTEFLNRLIQRANGQLPGIKPLIRSSFGTLPVVNETATEFEETVAFYNNTNPISPPRKLSVSRVESPETPGKHDMQETRDSVQTTKEPEPRLITDTDRDSARRERKLFSESAQENEKMVSPEGENIPVELINKMKTDVRGQDSNAAISDYEISPRIESQIRQPEEREIRLVNRQTLISPRVQPETTASVENRQASDSNNQTSSKGGGNITQRETTETIEETQLVSPDVFIPETGSPGGIEIGRLVKTGRPIETGRSSEPGHQVNIQQYSIKEKSPSTNLRVSIGRIEIKAIQQSEPQIRSKPAVPVGPAVSLDSYLKDRDEKKR
jgi:hypothetical protein